MTHVIGRFTTTQYDCRSDFERSRPSGILVSHNRFTLVGMEWMWNMMAGYLRSSDGTLTDHIGNARLVVGNGDRPFEPTDERLAGDQTAQASLDNGYPQVRRVAVEDGPQAAEIVFSATFGEREGIFDWAERGVVSSQGILLDRAVSDQGRKPFGAVWTVEAALRLDS